MARIEISYLTDRWIVNIEANGRKWIRTFETFDGVRDLIESAGQDLFEYGPPDWKLPKQVAVAIIGHR